MSIKHNVIIAVAAIALSASGCAEELRQNDKPTGLAPEPEPFFASTLAPTEPEPVVDALPAPAVAEEEEAVVQPELATPEAAETPRVESVDGVTIQRFFTAPEIVNREPVDPTSTFLTSDEKVYAFVDASNTSESAKHLFVHFIGPEGKVSGGVELEIPPAVPRWRTWAYTRHFDVPGLWRVEIRDAEGSLVGALPFVVEGDL